ncbi:sugar nucleotide-binding protein [Plantactinospora sp. KBS50]|uniref:sugar nucleotide-binding protein n=1 Tax=Plantactinospora sp. KBS50 TaxID=2024580 RepID=UPI000BAAB00C|nr:sugar nucleotide-binding protein [Plantactinospora sp. KBS50]ASW54665.1 dTDP-4-dehydrorhamnose reductase [Plantactinospora sp. KBS50]
MTWLVVGASGYLGGELCRQVGAAGDRVVGTYRSTPLDLPGTQPRRLDVRDRAAVRELVTAVRPDVVINTAYDTADWATTADAAGYVAVAAAEVGARLVFVSSDALHAGAPEPYGDDVPPSPVNPYGAAKAAAETAVRLVDPGAVLVRTSLIIGDERSKQIQLCLAALAGTATLFSDEIRCPVGVADLASALRELAVSPYTGVLNVAGPDAVSRPELGRLVAGRYGLDPAALRTTTRAEAGLSRPGDVRLDSSRAADLVRTRLRGAHELLTGGTA